MDDLPCSVVIVLSAILAHRIMKCNFVTFSNWKVWQVLYVTVISSVYSAGLILYASVYKDMGQHINWDGNR